jgi:superoxide reductase
MGTQQDKVYKCEQCGNVVYVLESGEGDLVCCGEEMKLLTDEESQPYHPRFPKPGAP